MLKRYTRPIIISLILLLLLCFSFIILPSENAITIIGIILIGITDKNVVMHPIYPDTYIVKAAHESGSGYDIFEEYMQGKGYLLEERLGSIWVFKMNGEKLVLVSSYKNMNLLCGSEVIIFNP